MNTLKYLYVHLLVICALCSQNTFAAGPDDFNPSDFETEIQILQKEKASSPSHPEGLRLILNPPSGSFNLSKYQHLDPEKKIRTDKLREALTVFDSNLDQIKNQNYLTLIDLSLSSTIARFFLVDMKSGQVQELHTAHGKGSDRDHDGYAEYFSNQENSQASSLGFYMTGETYEGSNGYSLRLDGLSKTNSKARDRAIVIHGASYVSETNQIQGRSWGCPALSTQWSSNIIQKIKEGSLIWAFD